LRVDSSNIGFGIGDHVGPWVDAFNRTLGENNKQLESFEVRDGKIIMTKRVVPAVAKESAATVAPTTTATVGGTTGSTSDDEKSKVPGGCVGWLLGGIAAIAATVGLVAVVTSDDAGDDTITGGTQTPVATESPIETDPPVDPPTTTVAPTTTERAADPPVVADPDPLVDADEAATALRRVIDSMTVLEVTDGGTLDADGRIVDSTPGLNQFDIEMRAAIGPNGHLWFYFEGPTVVVNDIAIEWDALGQDGFTVLAETGFAGAGDDYPSYALSTPQGTLHRFNEAAFDSPPERVGALVVSDITNGFDFLRISGWLHSSFIGDHFDYTHYDFLVDQLIQETDVELLREVLKFSNPDHLQTQKIRAFLANVDQQQTSIIFLDLDW
jgi:hypothetical protein